MRSRRDLTDLAVRNAKPKDEYYDIPDPGQRGLKLRVYPSGAKSWIVLYHHPITGKSAKLTLPFPIDSQTSRLADARKMASDAIYLVAQGIDPRDAKKAEREAKAAKIEGALAAVGERYLDLGSPKRSRDLYRRVLARVFTHLGARPVAELKRSEIVAMLDKIERDSGPRAADLTLAIVRAMLRWYQTRSDSFVSPIIPGMARLKASEHARTKLLTDAEIRAVWEASFDKRIGTYGAVIRFMLLSGARRSEAAGLRRSEIGIDDETGLTVWRLPASRSKNKREVVRPLSKAALQIIGDMPIIGEDSDFVFTLNGIRPMSMNYQDRKDLLDEISGVTGWVLHDTRRVFRSMLSRVRTPHHTAERLLGHAMPVLTETYDRHHPLVEMLEAAERVAAEIERIVSGERGGQVIRLHI